MTSPDSNPNHQTIHRTWRRNWRRLRRRFTAYNMSGWWDPFFDIWTGGDRRPRFFDIDATMPELRLLDRGFEDIRAEFLALLPERRKMPRYHELDPDIIYASGRFQRDKSWNVFMLYTYGYKPTANRTRCPRTVELLAQIPHLSQAFFSILDPGKCIPAHEGPTRSYLRYHLALKVPEDDPPHIRVVDETYTWREGESVLFDDSWEHEVVNRASEPRAVLIVDVLRPLPAFPHACNVVLRHGLGHLMYGRRMKKAIETFPERVRRVSS